MAGHHGHYKMAANLLKFDYEMQGRFCSDAIIFELIWHPVVIVKALFGILVTKFVCSMACTTWLQSFQLFGCFICNENILPV